MAIPSRKQTYYENCRDLLDKLKREIERYRSILAAQQVNIEDLRDTAFNASVTAWHLADWTFNDLTLAERETLDASHALPKAKASYWRTAFRFALDEIGALVGLTTTGPKRPAVPERYALQAAVVVATVRKNAP